MKIRRLNSIRQNGQSTLVLKFSSENVCLIEAKWTSRMCCVELKVHTIADDIYRCVSVLSGT